MSDTGVLDGINSAVGAVTQIGGQILQFSEQIATTITTIQDQASGNTQCQGYIEQIYRDITTLQQRGNQLNNQTGQRIVLLQTQIEEQKKSNQNYLPLLQNQQMQMQATQNQLLQIQAKLQSKLGDQKSYQIELETYSKQLADLQQKITDCQQKGFTKSQEIVAVFVILLFSITITAVSVRLLKKSKQYTPKSIIQQSKDKPQKPQTVTFVKK